MTGYELQKYIKEGLPFYVYGDVMEYNSAKGDKGDPHKLYRNLLQNASLAVNVITPEEWKSCQINPYVKKEIVDFLQELSLDENFKDRCLNLLHRLGCD